MDRSLFPNLPESTKIASLPREELETYTDLLEKSVTFYQVALKKAYERFGVTEEERLAVKDELVIVKRKIFGPRSEKRPKNRERTSPEQKQEKSKKKVLLPSERYPDVPIVEEALDFEASSIPSCQGCGTEMKKMNQTEDSQYITVRQKEFYIVQQSREKYRCPCCYGSIRTTPSPKRMKPGSAFSDEVAIDVAVSKYAEHMPVERYAVQAERLGLRGIHPQTLIAQTHYLSDTLKSVYERLKEEVQRSAILHSDETPWKMLEGDEKKNWFMWGFFANQSAYYEAKNSRATEAAKDFIHRSDAEYLLTDAYSGYARCTEGTKIQNAYCMAHARRKFVDAELNYPQATPILEKIGELYGIERAVKGKDPPERRKIRQEQSKPIVDQIREDLFALAVLPKSSIGKARNYMLRHWKELTRFLEEGRLSIDNNLSERGLRGVVLGRKNYLGNHSKRGARTTATLYSIIESCKLNNVEPYQYLKDTVYAILNEKTWHTPVEYAKTFGVRT